jgi:hypothetical protein
MGHAQPVFNCGEIAAKVAIEQNSNYIHASVVLG